MTPLSPAITELRLAVDRAYAKSLPLLERHGAGERLSQGELQDHRTEIQGDFVEALNRIDAGLGDALLAALYPTVAELH